MADFASGIKRKSLWKNIALFFAIVGPGIITGSVDNDVGGITTYSVAGAQFGYQLIWTLIPAFIVLFVTQEMNARMGIVTGKGLADLIRENTGVKVTFFIVVLLLAADVMNTMTEFSGVAGSMQIFGVSKYISVPLVALGVWFVVVKGTYKVAEKIFLVFCLALFVYVAAALLGKPDWKTIGQAIVKPRVETDFPYIATVIGLIGTTIAPWMQFYMQSSVIEKQLRLKDLKWSKLDVFIGCLCTVVVAFFIMISCASTLHAKGVQINTAADAAAALTPVAGSLASEVFAFGLFVASVFAAVILPVAVAFYVCEAFGYEAGIDRTWEEAPQFYWLYTGIIVLSAGMILIPNAPLIEISLWSQRINGIMLPVVLLCMMLIVNKKEVMGKYVNKPVSNLVCWATIIILLALSVTMAVSLVKG